MHAGMDRHALRQHLRGAAVDEVLLHLEVGDAVAEQAADLGVLLKEVNVVPGARELLRTRHPRRSRADDRNTLAGLRRGDLRPTQPSWKPRSAIAASIVLIVTGCSIRFSVQDASQGAGQTRPVTSGKLFVVWRFCSAPCQSPL